MDTKFERPEDMDKVLTGLSSDIEYLKHIITSTVDFGSSPTIVYSIDSAHFKQFLEKIVQSLELLSGYVEDLEAQIEKRDNEIKKYKNFLVFWKNSYKSECEKRDKSEKMLKLAVNRIDGLYARLLEVQSKAGMFTYRSCDDEYVKDKVTINDGSNFCGNCRYCGKTVSGKYVCVQNHVRYIDPDDSSCQYFKTPYEKPDHICCEKCTRADEDSCANCILYPF